MFGDLLRLQVVVLEGVSRAVSECMLKKSPLIFPVQERRVDLKSTSTTCIYSRSTSFLDQLIKKRLIVLDEMRNYVISFKV